MRRSVAALLVLAAGCVGACGGGPEPLRIGVVVDCVGISRSLQDAELSGAELPLIERGARRTGRRAVDGITTVEVAGRPVELRTGCTEALEFSVLTRELRRLAEIEHVDAVVAAGTGPDELIVRDVARAHPDVTFLPVVHGPREVTLRRAAPNVYRFAADYGQGVAGLASYAYHRLHWRRAAVVLGDWDAGWLSRDAFTAEFCALGGKVTKPLAVLAFDPAGRDVKRVPRDVDGVAVFAGQFFEPAGFIKRLARRFDDPRSIVVGPEVVDEPGLLRATGGALAGVTASSFVDPARMTDYLRQYDRAFPGTGDDVARSELVSGYRGAVEAVLRALEAADGDKARVPDELARRRVDLLSGPVRLDGNGQAVTATSLVRIGGPASVSLIDRVGDVDQSIGGLLAPSLSPSSPPPRCVAGRSPPAWAR